MRFILIAFLASITLLVQAQEIDRSKGDPKLSEYYNPEAPVVTPGKTAHDAPSDAIILFDGKNFSNWEGDKNQPIGWTLENGPWWLKADQEGLKPKGVLAIARCI